jgi:hypothetical protein
MDGQDDRVCLGGAMALFRESSRPQDVRWDLLLPAVGKGSGDKL